MDLAWWQWTVAAIGAFLIGLSKTGVAGLGVFAPAIFALVIPPRQATGAVLPILIAGDIVAISVYRRNAVWSHLWRLLPFAVVGIVIGTLVLGRVDNLQAGRLIGVILLALVVLQIWRGRNPENVEQAAEFLSRSVWLAAAVGVLAGFTTMIANAAATVILLYFIAMRLPKIEFMGTGAWYFFITNLIKLPFSYSLGLITFDSLGFDATMAPFAVVGALLGAVVIHHIDQKRFEQITLVLTVLAAARLVIG